MQAVDLHAPHKLRRGEHVWTIRETDYVDPTPLGRPYVKITAVDHLGTVQHFTLPADFPVVVVD